MATVKVIFRPSDVKGKPGRLYYRVIHNRMQSCIVTPYRIYPHEWDRHMLKIQHSENKENVSPLSQINADIEMDLNRMARIIHRLEERGLTYTAEEVCGMFSSYVSQLSWTDYMARRIAYISKYNRTSTPDHYKSAFNSFKRYLAHGGRTDIMLDDISAETMCDYQAYLKSRGLSRNSSSFYMRILRAVYNKAVDDGLIEQRLPFRRVYTGIAKTVKRAISLELVSRIKTLDLTGDSKLDYARDMFILSFYLRGMSFVDMAFLKKSDLQSTEIIYRRRKTGKLMAVKWTFEMQQIVNKYQAIDTEYLLPILKSKDKDNYSAYQRELAKVNAGLSRIGRMVESPVRLTHYVARHSWASGAWSKGIPIPVISVGMGHDSEMTTRIYLATLDTAAVDRANDMLINAVR